MKIPESILISRIDSVGDVVLALPVAGMLKKRFPGIKVGLLASQYTRSIAAACIHIDSFIDIEDFLKDDVLIDGSSPGAILHLVTNAVVAKRAKELKIPIRVGTMSRFHHWFNCNKLIWLSRRKAGLHEAQSNLKLLMPFGIKENISLLEIAGLYGLNRFETLSAEYKNLLNNNKFNVILHPKSKGNAREWPADHFVKLINSLDDSLYTVFLSGVESERHALQEIANAAHYPVTNMAGKIPLGQFVSFIASADAVVSNSTGPVHISAALGKNTLGIYPSLTHKNPVRWAPIGLKVQTFVFQKDCLDCKDTPQQCHCISAIQPAEIKAALDKLVIKKNEGINY